MEILQGHYLCILISTLVSFFFIKGILKLKKQVRQLIADKKNLSEEKSGLNKKINKIKQAIG